MADRPARPAVVIVNVLGFYDPLRLLIQNAVDSGFIRGSNVGIVTFVDGPADRAAHETFDWGAAAVAALDNWDSAHAPLFDWTLRRDGTTTADGLSAT